MLYEVITASCDRATAGANAADAASCAIFGASRDRSSGSSTAAGSRMIPASSGASTGTPAGGTEREGACAGGSSAAGGDEGGTAAGGGDGAAAAGTGGAAACGAGAGGGRVGSDSVV